MENTKNANTRNAAGSAAALSIIDFIRANAPAVAEAAEAEIAKAEAAKEEARAAAARAELTRRASFRPIPNARRRFRIVEKRRAARIAALAIIPNPLYMPEYDFVVKLITPAEKLLDIAEKSERAAEKKKDKSERAALKARANAAREALAALPADAEKIAPFVYLKAGNPADARAAALYPYVYIPAVTNADAAVYTG